MWIVHWIIPPPPPPFLLKKRSASENAHVPDPSGVQVAVEPANFLLLVLVPVFFPGFAQRHLWLGFTDRSAAWLVAHDGLNALGESPHVVLKTEDTSTLKLGLPQWKAFWIIDKYITTTLEFVLLVRGQQMHCTWLKKFLSTEFSILLILWCLCVVVEMSRSSTCVFWKLSCCGWKSSGFICGGGWQYRSFPCRVEGRACYKVSVPHNMDMF